MPRPTSRSTLLALAVAAGLARPSAAAGQGSCRPLPRELGATVERGWTSYRANRAAQADSAFRAVLARCPNDPGALAGHGYARLRLDDIAGARVAFERAIAANARSYDAHVGAGLVARRAGDARAARRHFERALAILPNDATVRAYLAQLPPDVDSTRLAPIARPAATVVGARVGRRILEEPDGRGGWKPLWLKFVNLGAALPGKHPSEFPPDDGTYDRWIADIAELGANAVRVYTIHPPHFYRALRQHNLAHPASPVRLIHGVWTELPPGKLEERYDDPEWSAAFRAEMRRVVDLLHGHAAIEARPGHASGMYTADVSPWVSGYIIGREWEPYSVVEYARRNPRTTDYRGTYVTVSGGNAVDVWMARAIDYMVGYEMQRYNAQRPMAYTNWPTLDPLVHPTESTLAQEDSIRRARGEEVPEQPREFDNDAIGLDATRMKATPRFPAGLFASYHAYPYYPDFLVLDPGYRQARSPEGPSAYYGYLRELVAHHGDMPVVISEYGVPSSRGIAHFQPQGWDHGGHSEREQAEINARLTRDIVASGAAGAGVFALIDEWFKKNWIVIDFERPLERNRLWFNTLDAEQNYGLIAMRAGSRDSAITIDGRAGEWAGRGTLYEAPATPGDPLAVSRLRVAHDEAFLYLQLDVGAIDWRRAHYLIGIDTYDRALGDTKLPYTGARSPVGLEFVLDLRGPEASRLLVDEPYNLYRAAPIRGARPPAMQQVYHRPFRTRANADGAYDSLYVVTNRRRVGRDGTVFPAIGYDRNLLLHARQQDNTLADWYAEPAGRAIEIRIPWGMLHMVDPSRRWALFGDERTGEIEGRPTDGFRFVVQSYDPNQPATTGTRLPRGTGGFGDVATYSWPTWEAPRWWSERKPAFEAMQRTFRAIPDDPRK
jgi:hypothetical protein